MTRLPSLLLAASAALLLARASGAAPVPVKVAVVVTFEVGGDTGDKPGEFQYWAEREKWPRKVSVPGLDHPVLVGDDGTIGVVGGTTGRAQSQIMALVLSGAFDFTRTYWLFNGIAGVNPAAASVGSAAWSRYVIDGDVAYEIDSREADPAWPYAIMPIGSKVPDEKPKREGWEPESMAYELNPRLVTWAFRLTKDTPIPDSPAMSELRSLYRGYPEGQRPPFVLLGDSFGSCRFWHGATLTRWASDWTRLWTDGKGSFVMTDMEDQGFASAMQRLAKMGRVDFGRVLFLRTGSNYCMQPPGMDVNKSMHGEFAGYIPSLEAAYRVGSRVVREISGNWATYRGTVPGP
ncbi:MAG TPA: purine nucleoside permease [Opitutaceae bacterium]|jgi:purine nucleoside permease